MLAALPRSEYYGGSAPYALFGVLTAYPSKTKPLEERGAHGSPVAPDHFTH